MDHNTNVPHNSFHCVFDYIEWNVGMECNISTFSLMVKVYNAYLELDINNPRSMDLNMTCFMMLTSDLFNLIGLIASLANCKVKVKDMEKFKDWMHVIFDFMVVKMYDYDTIEKKYNTFNGFDEVPIVTEEAMA